MQKGGDYKLGRIYAICSQR